MKKPAEPASDPNVIAALHKSGGVWRGIIASSKSPKPATLASKEFPAEQFDRIDGWLTEHQVGEVLCVLPAAAVICRNSTLPDAPPEQLQQALQLQAEAGLMGIAPPHRVAMAVLPQSPGETSRTGIILAWPEAAVVETPRTTRSVKYVPDMAALAAILNGQRPNDPLLWLDRADGSVALAITHAGGANFRGTREDSSSAELWEKSVGRIAAETSLSVGHTGAFIEKLVQDIRRKAASQKPNASQLYVPNELIAVAAARIQGLSSDPAWWAHFGIAAGALIARLGPLSSLTGLLSAPPVVNPSLVERATDLLSNTRTATRVVIACVLLLMLGPLAVAGLRLGILKLRFGDINQQLASAGTSKQQVAMYRELERQKAWPMAKLLADINTNIPLGIELDMIRIDGGKDFSVSGTAKSNDSKTPLQVVTAMQQNLSADGIFTDVTLKIGSGNNLGMFKFDMSAEIARPYKIVKYPEARDFTWTYAQRLYGGGKPDKSGKPPEPGSLAAGNAPDAGVGALDGSSPAEHPNDRTNHAAESSTAQPVSDSNPAKPNAGRPDRSKPAAASGAASEPDHPVDRGMRPTSPSGPIEGVSVPGDPGEPIRSAAADIPEPITDEQIQAMALPDLRAQLTKIAGARKYHKDNAELDARLKKEMDAILAQIKKVKG